MSARVRPTRVEATIEDYLDDLPQLIIDNMMEQLADEAQIEPDRYGNYITVTSTIQVAVDDIVDDLIRDDDLTSHLRLYDLKPTVVGKDSGNIDLVYE